MTKKFLNRFDRFLTVFDRFVAVLCATDLSEEELIADRRLQLYSRVRRSDKGLEGATTNLPIVLETKNSTNPPPKDRPTDA